MTLLSAALAPTGTEESGMLLIRRRRSFSFGFDLSQLCFQIFDLALEPLDLFQSGRGVLFLGFELSDLLGGFVPPGLKLLKLGKDFAALRVQIIDGRHIQL